LDEPGNLGVKVIEAMEVTPEDVRSELEATMKQELDGTRPGIPVLTPNADRVLALGAEEARNLGHNYLGCEHLLLGLIAEPEGIAGRVLRTMGLDLVVTRRAVVTALTGFVHARANAPSAAPAEPVARALADITTRLDRIESQLAASK